MSNKLHERYVRICTRHLSCLSTEQQLICSEIPRISPFMASNLRVRGVYACGGYHFLLHLQLTLPCVEGERDGSVRVPECAGKPGTYRKRVSTYMTRIFAKGTISIKFAFFGQSQPALVTVSRTYVRRAASLESTPLIASGDIFDVVVASVAAGVPFSRGHSDQDRQK